MSAARDHFHARAHSTLRMFAAMPGLRAAVAERVDAFFAKYPDIERNELTAGFIASLELDVLIDAPDSQSAAAPNAETTKVA